MEKIGDLLSIIDTTVMPDPFNPQPGDVYARDIVAASKTSFKQRAELLDYFLNRDIPYRIVVQTVRELKQHQTHRIVAYRDGNETAFTDASEFAAMLASVPGMHPIGRLAAAPSGDRRELDVIRRLLDETLKPIGHTPDPLQSVASLASIVVNRLSDFEAHAAEAAGAKP